jgi:hypothetical protein
VDFVPIGMGIASYVNGDTFEGVYLDGKRNGLGRYLFKNGASYEGNYSQNQKSGMGTMNYPDKSIYQGNFHSFITKSKMEYIS